MVDPVGGDRPRPSRLLAGVIALVGLEALLLLVAAAVVLVELARSSAADPGAAAATALLAVLLAVLLLSCARGLRSGRRWARGPVMTWQVLQILVVLSGALAGQLWLAAALVGASVFAAVVLVLPAVVAETGTGGDPPVA